MPQNTGRATQLLLQRESDFRTLPGSPSARALKFSPGLEFKDDMEYLADPTINNQPLANKQDCDEEGHSLKIPAILCLNDIGEWLTLALGTPTTTSVSGGKYQHIFTLDLDPRPSAMLELGYTQANQYRRWLGCMLNKLSWGIKDSDQDITVELIGATQDATKHTAPYMATPSTQYQKNRACSRKGLIRNQGNTLGRVLSATLSIENDLEGKHTADGEPGYGLILLGEPSVSGTLNYVQFEGDSFSNAEDHTSVDLQLTVGAPSGDTLQAIIPAAELGKPSYSVPTSKTLLQEGVPWRAHASANPVQFVLTNGIATYA